MLQPLPRNLRKVYGRQRSETSSIARKATKIASTHGPHGRAKRLSAPLRAPLRAILYHCSEDTTKIVQYPEKISRSHMLVSNGGQWPS